MLLSWHSLCNMLRLSLVVAAARLGRSLVPAMMQTRWTWCRARAAARPGEVQPSTSSHSAWRTPLNLTSIVKKVSELHFWRGKIFVITNNCSGTVCIARYCVAVLRALPLVQ